ncbi:N-acetylmuramoyl-L-alanine amidase CwlD [Alkalibacillus almallahensis]|uniref:N-acetylmuramoyl-L-alanine amidase CwlD n=1 Tax=Alkalibacillus almallahensis TaxID=1379154 RepID=UPI001422D892|nr:N-acetylmuramoyl-L-alanine amidase CwlD [Alkalibacillus almallahensis]NIK12986.1 N-acetylmuramoyl-L-alanine amidase [Alkalibacillus almallahensis]
MKKYIVFAFISVVLLGLSLYSVLWDRGMTNSSANVMPLAGQVIVLDPGHGGVDGGADYGEDQEKTVTLQTALFLRDYLQEAGAQVVLTRDGDYDLAPEDMDGYSKRKSYDIRRRVKLIQDVEADVFVSIHLNSVVNESWRGAQTFYYPGEEENKRLANAIQERLRDSIETNRQTLAMDNVYILKHAETTSALVEMGFLSNSEERALLTSEDYQRRLASSIYEGIVEYVTAEQEL